MKLILVLSLVLGASGYDGWWPPWMPPRQTPGALHDYVTQQRQNLFGRFDVAFSQLDWLDNHKYVLNCFPYSPLHYQCAPAQETYDLGGEYYTYLIVKDDAPNGRPNFDPEKLFRQLKNKELREGADLGINEIFVPLRNTWGYDIVNCGGKQMIIAAMSPNRRWKYSHFGLSPEGSPGYETTTTTTTTTTPKPTTTTSTTTTTTTTTPKPTTTTTTTTTTTPKPTTTTTTRRPTTKLHTRTRRPRTTTTYKTHPPVEGGPGAPVPVERPTGNGPVGD